MTPSSISAFEESCPRTVSSHAVADELEFVCSNLRGNFKHLPNKLHFKQTVSIFRSLAVYRKNLTARTLASALPNGNSESNTSSSHASAGGLIPMENDNSSKDEDVKVQSSFSISEEDFSLSAGHLGNEWSLLDKLKAVHLHVLASEQWNASRLKLCHRNYLVSATNLIHYRALKCLDIEQLEEDLSFIGLLNLSTINLNVLASLTAAAIQLLENLKSNSLNTKESGADSCKDKRIDCRQKNGKFTIQSMNKRSSSNTELLLGTRQIDKTTHIMVTVGITDLLKMGTSIIRINYAHGDPSVWSDIITKVKRTSQMLEKPCRVLMDLAGPKLRTGNLKSGPSVLKISPKRNASGIVIFPAQVWLSHKEAGPPPPHLSLDAVLLIDNQDFLSQVKLGDSLGLYDARGKKRMFKITRRFHVFAGIGFLAKCMKTSYVKSGTQLYTKGKKHIGHVVNVPA